MGPIVLVIGNLQGWGRAGRGAPDVEGFHFVDFVDLTHEMLDALAPDLVLSALMGEDHDAIDLARDLHRFGYAGRYRALTNALPNPQTVVDEVRLAAPDLDFDLFILSGPRPS